MVECGRYRSRFCNGVTSWTRAKLQQYQETEGDRVGVLNPASEETFDSEACKLESLSEKEVSVAERE